MKASPSRVLGLSAYYHDSAATLLVDGRIEAAAQEERFSRLKHDPRFPGKAIEYCLSHSGCQFGELDAVVFYDKPFLKFERLLETHLARAPWGLASFLRSMPIWLKEKLYLKLVLDREFRRIAGYAKKDPLPPLYFAEHHQSHAASAFFASPFETAAVLCVDGVGEWATTSLWVGQGSDLKPLKEIQFPHSLGLLYSAFTQYCGFRVNSGEYKLMGLAPYGQPVYARRIREHLIGLREDGSFELNMKFFEYPTGRTMVGKRFERLFDAPAREIGSAPRQREADLAASVQAVLEEAMLAIARHAHAETGCENLCLAGGVALNCVANQRLLEYGPFRSIWVQPAAGDAGGSLGAALLYWYQRAASKSTRGPADAMQGSFLGPEYSNGEVREFLQGEGVSYSELDPIDVLNRTAQLLSDGKVVGWFQGRMEFGPRALGNRSMLADPRNPDMQRILNLRIKGRESFRPFAPAVMAEYAQEYFDVHQSSPYMLFVAKLLDDLREHGAGDDPSPGQVPTSEDISVHRAPPSKLPAVTHVDYSCRLQTVHAETNPRFHALLAKFHKITGVPVLLNTSFNVRGEPVVCAPTDALRCFLATDLDYLVIGDFLLDKQAQSASKIADARSVTFEAD